MNWDETKKDIKNKWITFLLFGVAIIIINTTIQVGLTSWMDSQIQGDPCRVDFPIDKFTFNKLDEHFKIEYLMINLRDKDLQIEGIDAYCYWKTEKETKQDKEIKESVTHAPSIEQISTPLELDKIDALSSEVRSSNCKSPDREGTYKIKIIVRTTEGICEGMVLMEVKDE